MYRRQSSGVLHNAASAAEGCATSTLDPYSYPHAPPGAGAVGMQDSIAGGLNGAGGGGGGPGGDSLYQQQGDVYGGRVSSMAALGKDGGYGI